MAHCPGLIAHSTRTAPTWTDGTWLPRPQEQLEQWCALLESHSWHTHTAPSGHMLLIYSIAFMRSRKPPEGGVLQQGTFRTQMSGREAGCWRHSAAGPSCAARLGTATEVRRHWWLGLLRAGTMSSTLRGGNRLQNCPASESLASHSNTEHSQA